MPGETCGVLAGSRAFRSSLSIRLAASGQGKPWHNPLRPAFGTYSGLPWSSAPSLMQGRYGILRGKMPFWMAFHLITVLYFTAGKLPLPAAP
jgi:hypothetical protein